MPVLRLVVREEVRECAIEVLCDAAFGVHEVVFGVEVREADADGLVDVHDVGVIAPAVAVVHEAVGVRVVVTGGVGVRVALEEEGPVLLQQATQAAAAGPAIDPYDERRAVGLAAGVVVVVVVIAVVVAVAAPIAAATGRGAAIDVVARFDEPIEELAVTIMGATIGGVAVVFGVVWL